MSDTGFTIIPKDQPELMARLQLLAVAQGLHLELKTGMKLRRGLNALTVAKSLGFKGSRKEAGLHWVLAQMRANEVTVTPSLAKWEAENPA